MDVTELPMTTDAREVQFRNASFPMDVTEPRSTDERDVQFRNAYSPMDVTESGTVTDVREVHPENA